MIGLCRRHRLYIPSISYKLIDVTNCNLDISHKS